MSDRVCRKAISAPCCNVDSGRVAAAHHRSVENDERVEMPVLAISVPLQIHANAKQRFAMLVEGHRRNSRLIALEYGRNKHSTSTGVVRSVHKVRGADQEDRLSLMLGRRIPFTPKLTCELG
eukprot:TRINITY_DN11260_c0_g1_i1.p4 TRINITY_DN11260_c0_g1~~TRINITY_DN11260_c0_g1_i1.p4  ORF type:complete len:122 (-),score=1.41 TRINITY_DN11260_c0_g1_i1:667-1032(-)